MISSSNYFKNFFFNTYMKKGKKSKSEKIFFDLFSYIQKNRYKKLKQTSDFKSLIYKNAPILITRRKKFGRFYRQIPFLLNTKTSLKLPVKFLFNELKNKNNKGSDKNKILLKFFISLHKKKGPVYQNLSSLRKDASKNKRNYKFQW